MSKNSPNTIDRSNVNRYLDHTVSDSDTPGNASSELLHFFPRRVARCMPIRKKPISRLYQRVTGEARPLTFDRHQNG